MPFVRFLLIGFKFSVNCSETGEFGPVFIAEFFHVQGRESNDISRSFLIPSVFHVVGFRPRYFILVLFIMESVLYGYPRLFMVVLRA